MGTPSVAISTLSKYAAVNPSARVASKYIHLMVVMMAAVALHFNSGLLLLQVL